MMKIRTILILSVVMFLTFGVMGATALPKVSFWADAEAGAVFTGYNNVQIPADTGTRFSLATDLSPNTTLFYRLQAGADMGRHSLLLLYAPLLVQSTGTAPMDITFYGHTYPAGTQLTGSYKFNSYRLTYAYTFLDRSRLQLALGLTGKIRDAYIALDDGTTATKRTDLGFVPLIHLKAQWEFAPPFALLLEGDGLAAPQGRAEDFLLALLYSPKPAVDLRLGYRILEGGSDGGGSVYTFSMFHYLTAGVRWHF